MFMKHINLFILFILLSVSYSMAQQVCPGNLLNNPSFENGLNNPGDVNNAPGWIAGKATYPLNTAQWNNLNGVCFGYNDQSGSTMYQTVPVTIGHNYTLSFNVGMYHPMVNSGSITLAFLDNSNTIIGTPAVHNVTADVDAIPNILFVGATQTLNISNAPANAANVRVSISYTNNNINLTDRVMIDGICLTSSPACNNVLDGGIIGSNETFCGNGFQPTNIQNIQSPNGGIGTLEYVWIQSLDAGVTFTVIPNANNDTYTPPYITQSTWYRRCARRTGCAAYIGESNWVMKKVANLPTVDAGNTLYLGCGVYSGVLNASYNANSAYLNWSPSTGLSSSIISQPFAFPNTTTTYTLTITDNNNCVNSDTVTVFVNNATLSKPFLTSSSTTPLCAGSNVTLTATGQAGATFNWTFPPGCNATINNTISGQSTVNITAVSAACSGTYTVNQSLNGCTSPNESIQISTYDSLQVTVTTTNETCFGQSNGSTHTQVSGGSGNYHITHSALLNCPGCPADYVQWLSPGTYTITVTDMGCNGTTQTYTSTVNPGAIVPQPTVQSPIITCAGSPLQLIGNTTLPATTINWTYGPNQFNAIGNPSIIQNATTTMTGKYGVKALDNNGCASAPIEVDVVVYEKPTIDSVSITCTSNTPMVSIYASVSSGTLLYSWDGITYTNQNQFTNLTPGNYTLSVKNAPSNCITQIPISVPNCNCTNTPIVTLSASKVSCSTTPIPVNATFTNVTQATFTSTGNGTFNTTIGTSPLNISYTPSLSDLAIGHVILTLTTDDPDGAGLCTPVSKSITIQLKDSLSIPTILSNQINYCQGDTVLLTTNTDNIEWLLPNNTTLNQDSLILTGTNALLNGNYSAILNGNGCISKADTFALSINNAPTLNVTLDITDEHCTGSANGAVKVNINGGTGIYNACYIQFSNCSSLQNSPIEFKWLSPGNYTMYVADASCPNAWTTTNYTIHPGITVAPPTSANYNTGLCAGDTLYLNTTGLPGEYIWTNNVDNCVLIGMNVYRPLAHTDMNGTYKVQRVVDGCASESLYLDVKVYETPSIVSADTSCTNANDGTITVNALAGNNETLEYAINNGAFQLSNQFTELSNGLYNISVKPVGSNCVTTVSNIELACVSLKEINLSVFPNPNNGSFAINANLPEENSSILINVYDMNGKKIYEAVTESHFKTLNHSIDIKGYAHGAYLLRVTIDNERYVLPIIVNE